MKCHNVLIVDADTRGSALLDHRLTQREFSVERCESGEAALARLRRGALPDLLLYHADLPGMTAWQLLGALKTEPAYARMPALVYDRAAADSFEGLLGTVERICAESASQAAAPEFPSFRGMRALRAAS